MSDERTTVQQCKDAAAYPDLLAAAQKVVRLRKEWQKDSEVGLGTVTQAIWDMEDLLPKEAST